MELSGVIKVIGKTEQVSDKFKKRTFVLTDNSSQYPQHIEIQLTQDKVSLLDKYKVGDAVKAHLNIRGKEWVNPKGETKYFTTIEAWKLDKADATDTQTNVAEQSFTNHAPDSDLPF